MSYSKKEYYFLTGGGQMGQLIRAKDWSKTPFGSPDFWPQSLRSIVSLMLSNPLGMYIAWGDDYTQLYNDPFSTIICSNSHANVLGSSPRETFSEKWDQINPIFKEVMQGKAYRFPDYELPVVKNGVAEVCYFDFSFSPIRKEDGGVGGVLVTFIETTEKKRATQELKESNLRFFNSIMQAPVAMCIFRGKDHVVEIANDQMVSLWGKNARQVIGNPLFTGLPEAKNQGLESILDNVFETGEKFVANERPIVLPRNGKTELTYINFIAQAIKENDDTISGVVIIATEVTEQVLSRFKLIESEQKVRALVDNAPFPIAVIVGEEMRIELANDSIKNIWGKGPDIIGKSYKDVLPELHDQLVFEQIKNVFTTGKAFHSTNTQIELVVNGKQQTYYFNYSFTPLYDTHGKIYAVMNTGVDLTDLNIATKKIEESEQNLRSKVLQSPIGICVIDSTTLISEIVNNSFIEIAGKPYEELVGKYYWDIFGEVKKDHANALQKVVDEGTAFSVNEVEMTLVRDSKPDIIYVTFVYAPLKNTEGKVKKVVIWVLDNTQQVIARRKIEEANKRFRNTVKQAPVGITILRGEDFTVEMANSSYLQLVDREEANFVGKPLLDSLPEVQDAVGPLLENVYRTGMPYYGKEVAVPLLRHGTKAICYFDFLYHPLKEVNGEISGIIVTATEVTENVESRKITEQNEQRLNIVVEAGELGTWELDVKNNKLSYSKKYLEIIGGYQEDLVLPLEVLEKHVHPDDLEIRAKAIEMAYKTGSLHFKSRVIWLDQSIHWIEARGKVFYDDNKEPARFIGTVNDITEERKQQQELEESEQKFRLLAGSMPQHVWTTDPLGKVNYFNQSLFEYSGLSAEESYKDGWLQLVHILDRQVSIAAWNDAIKTGNDFNQEHRFRRHDGLYRWQLSRARPQKDEDGNIQMWVGISTDIQEQKTFSNELERQVAERTEELEENNISLEKMNKELQSFAYISSHDLQEPLRKIQNFASLIIEKEGHSLSENVKDKFGKIQNAARRMQTLINDLLTYSKVNTHTRKFEIVNLTSIVEEVKEDLTEELEQKNAIIEGNINCDLPLIPFQIRQLLYNLLSNSLKFSKPGIPPIITINCDCQLGKAFHHPDLLADVEYCHIRIADNGIGFEQEYSHKIFEVFQRLHGKNEYSGTGIGLAIVKKIVDNHHGAISASGEPNMGATFDIYLPLIELGNQPNEI